MRRIWIVLAGVAAVAGVLVPAPPAAAQDAGRAFPIEVPATSFAFHPSTAGGVRHGKVVLWANGSATTTVDLPATAGVITFGASADRCGPGEGAALELRVDGELVFQHEVVGEQQNWYGASGSWAPGRHHLSFRFTNDRLTAECDRNAKLFFITVLDDDDTTSRRRIQQRVDVGTITVDPPYAGGLLAGGYGLPPVLHAPGTMRFVVDSYGATELELRLWRDGCGPHPRVRVRVDGRPLTPHDDATPWIGLFRYEETGGPPGPWPDGVHVIEVEMLDDGGASCDPHVGLFALYFRGWL